MLQPLMKTEMKEPAARFTRFRKGEKQGVAGLFTEKTEKFCNIGVNVMKGERLC